MSFSVLVVERNRSNTTKQNNNFFTIIRYVIDQSHQVHVSKEQSRQIDSHTFAVAVAKFFFVQKDNSIVKVKCVGAAFLFHFPDVKSVTKLAILFLILRDHESVPLNAPVRCLGPWCSTNAESAHQRQVISWDLY